MMEVKGKKKFTGKGAKTSQEKSRVHKKNGKRVTTKQASYRTWPWSWREREAG